MNYNNIKPAKFISRPNRFIANIEVDGQKEICHVKNTGRCKELLISNADIFVQEVDSKNRKTKYDLISVYKDEKLINIDSQAPNKVFYEWVEKGNFFGEISLIKPESKYKNSRFDFYLETRDSQAFIEVKGVTLEEKGVALFPDAPTERGVKHLSELSECLRDGYEAYVFFIIQMKDVLYFTPNSKTHQAFAEELKRAKNQGVGVWALDCLVTETSITARDFVEIRL
ncbi:MAG: DNA/RNA nuclease SfsA [Peptococcales bacterium]|jgi:sugar fermentation stimulation protein A